jgi:ribonuclease HI
MQKLHYAILITKHKPLHYFKSHPIRVVTSYGLEEIVGNYLTMRRIAKWALKLMGLDITYIPQTAIKSQALVDFVPEFTELQQSPAPVTQEHWSMYFDESFTLNGAEGGIVLISPKGERDLYVIRLHFCATNNVADYEALINGLRITTELRVQWLYIHGDSELVINQVMGESNCHDSRMVAYQQEVRKLEEKFDGFKLHHILQQDNEATDALTQFGSSRAPPLLDVFM